MQHYRKYQETCAKPDILNLQAPFQKGGRQHHHRYDKVTEHLVSQKPQMSPAFHKKHKPEKPCSGKRIFKEYRYKNEGKPVHGNDADDAHEIETSPSL